MKGWQSEPAVERIEEQDKSDPNQREKIRGDRAAARAAEGSSRPEPQIDQDIFGEREKFSTGLRPRTAEAERRPGRDRTSRKSAGVIVANDQP